ncbi:DmsE family decaheme c-type cytochrome [Geomesophilobacter sediminis]|uniref:DmsE family decaheme c-type cytochrome n=1 Tax=Geomesophilobacter sediminis TaxID=2798584 RepID=A0A8J7M2M2_9BACT|nr:DmsE family decaheme c-type cytochrome [Geomesophilobacter sediminis]MBJ6727613.1 DmsE family decaheme c-type cytochrome [Geomesophilobacter sediminis]
MAESSGARRIKLILLTALIGALGASCADLKQSRSLLPMREYERMIVGRLDAEYVGTANCVSRCHAHDKITDDFSHSVHGEQIKPETGLPLVNCESCHGPGSLAIEKLEDDPEKNTLLKKPCDYGKLLDIRHLPPMAQSLICLKCHSAASTPALSHWNASSHALNDVSCFDCHFLHRGPQQKVSRTEMAELCFRCHPDVRAENNLYSHHPLREKKMACTDCHEVHGSTQDKLLKGNNPKETCTRCHMEKQGPFAFEHGDVTENCLNCHTPHGSVNRPLLNAALPFLCLQCHTGHLANNSPGTKQLFTNRCTDCHSQIHGTDTPSQGRAGLGSMRQ